MARGTDARFKLRAAHGARAKDWKRHSAIASLRDGELVYYCAVVVGNLLELRHTGVIKGQPRVRIYHQSWLARPSSGIPEFVPLWRASSARKDMDGCRRIGIGLLHKSALVDRPCYLPQTRVRYKRVSVQSVAVKLL